MSLLDRFRRPAAPVESPKRSMSDWASEAGFMFGGIGYPGGMQMTMPGEKVEPIGTDFVGYVEGAYKANGPIFACIEARKSVFAEVRFQWQQVLGTKNLFGNPDLAILENPWSNATTGDLLARMEQHDSLAGNCYIIRRGNRLKVLRPDWTSIVIDSPSGEADDPDAEPIMYAYWPGGRWSGADPQLFMVDEIAHYAPTPDPTAHYRGMSWLTPVLKEIEADQGATKHKLKFFENAATPNLAVSLDKAVTQEQFKGFMEAMNESHGGVANAYKTLYLAGGADVTVIGSNLKELDFKTTQGAGETRIAAAANVPPIIAGFSEGLESATYSNYGQARRKFSDTYLRPHWRQAAGALQTIVRPPAGARLWYDATDVSFIQEDEKDAADIAAQQATTIRTLTDAGFTPDSVKLAVVNADMTQLVHSGLYSVQLQAAGSTAAAPAAP